MKGKTTQTEARQATETATIRTVDFDCKDDRSEQEGRAFEKHGANANPCCICGRHTDGSREVTVGGGYGTIIHPDDAERDDVVNDPGFMGCFDIGPDCARHQKIPAEFITRPSPEVA